MEDVYEELTSNEYFVFIQIRAVTISQPIDYQVI